MVIDTSVFIEHLRAKDKKNTELYKIPNSTIIYLSSVTLYELYLGATDKEKWEDIRLLTEDLTILPFDDM